MIKGNSGNRFSTEVRARAVHLVFEACGSCGDLVGFGGFNSVFEGDACDDFGQIIKAT
jgi:hypothetical protein